MDDQTLAQAKKNAQIHYTNCTRLINLCSQVLKAHPGDPHQDPFSDLEAGELTVAGQNVSGTLQTAWTFLNQPTIKPDYNPDFLNNLAIAAKAVLADVQIGVQLGTGGPNYWQGATAQNALLSAQNYTNNFRDPYNLGYANIPF